VMEEVKIWPDRVEYDGSNTLSGWALFSHDVVGYEAMDVDPGDGPLDTAYLYGTDGPDHFYADPEKGVLTAGDASYELIATGFPYVHGYGEGGDDTAELWDKVDGGPDSATNESVYAYENLVKMIGETEGAEFFRRAKDFDEVTAHGTGTDSLSPWGDAAYLRDGESRDLFTAGPGESSMEYDVDGPGPVVTVLDFDFVHGYALYGGVDMAELTDSPGNDTATSTPLYTKLYNVDEDDPGNNFFVRAKYFEEVEVLADMGGISDEDIARMYDSTLRDSFEADPATDTARMQGLDYIYDNRLVHFDRVDVYATAGGFDTALIRDLPGSVDNLRAAGARSDPGDDHWAQLDSDVLDYLYYVQGFDRAQMSYHAGEDVVHYDPAGEVADWLFTNELL